MCLSPVAIKNPNYGHDKHRFYKVNSFKYDCKSTYIYVPCGVCSECIALKQMSVVQRVQMEAKNSFLFFTTLTYDNEHLPRLSTSTGFEIPFADIRDLQLLFKRLRKKNCFGRSFRYYAVSERGSERGRPHFHIIWFLPMKKGENYFDGISLNRVLYNAIKDNWVSCSTNGRYSVNTPLFTFHQRFIGGKLKTNYDTHFVTPTLTSQGVSSLAFYVCKYLMKQNPKERRLQQAFKLNLPEDEYESSWSLVRSRSICSSSFGFGGSHNREDIISYIRSCVARSDRSLGYPCFFNPETGQSFPLCRTYRNNALCFSEKDWLDFNMDRSPFIERDDHGIQAIIKFHKIDKQISHVDSKDFTIDLPFILDYD